MKKFLLVVALATIALTGCGNRSAKKIRSEAEQAQLNYEHSQIRALYQWATTVEEKIQAFNATSPELEVPSVIELVDTSFLQNFHGEKLDEMLKAAKESIQMTEKTLISSQMLEKGKQVYK